MMKPKKAKGAKKSASTKSSKMEKPVKTANGRKQASK